MSEVMVWFSCCVTQRPPQKSRRRPIDRTMIGLPTDFRHTGHIGSADVCDISSTSSLEGMQGQMSSKGGYEHKMQVSVSVKVVDVQQPELT
ncbi:CDC42 small effector protein 2 [Lamellibrachia satsuma]|nr:CDC42 small effector protein 2 [Lamellibrachia satsuma]